jgi:ACS family sodium-dependent inorganic phosphate cotransporter-like MFS transporter 5
MPVGFFSATTGRYPSIFAIVSTGKEVGVIVTTPLAGLLCASDFLGGWPAAFYVFGRNGIHF